jgi:type VI secretion system secreted protein Hcp
MSVDIYLKIDGVDGESQDSNHKNEIEILSWSWGETNKGTAATGGGMGHGKVAMQDVIFVKGIDKASAKLMLACASGQHIKSAVLTCRKAGKEQQEYLKLSFSDVLVSSFQNATSYSFSGSGDQSPVPSEAASPVETFSLNFSKIEYGYKEQKADGTLGGAIQAHWSVKDNKGG